MSVTHVGRQAVVLGAGMGGIAAAAAVAPFFDDVTVLERDHLPDAAEARLGAPQGRHLHILLAGGQRALEGLLPGFTAALVEAGAVVTRANSDTRMEIPGHDPFPQRDFGWLSYCASRPLIEHTARRAAQAAGVAFLARRKVRRLEASPDGAAIAAVHFDDDEGAAHRLAADLVIDATGRGHPTLDLLKALRRPAPAQTAIGIDLFYASALFEMPADPPSDWKVAVTFPHPPQTTRGAVLAPVEGGRWILSMGGRADDAPPADAAGFMALVAGLRTPTIHEAASRARRIGEIATHGFRDSVWRHFERLEPLPRGLVPIADAICRFNPVYGQGMSVAAQEAALLARLLAERAGGAEPLADLSRVFLSEAQTLIEGPWRMSAIPDFANPLTRGERPANLEAILRFGAAFTQLAARDPEVHRLDSEVRQLLKPPAALADPALLARVAALMDETPAAA